MSRQFDPELEDVLQDAELLRIAELLTAAETPEAPLDDAFRSGLRRQLMERAWEATEGKIPWWRRLASPPGLAWAGAAAGLLLIAAVVVSTATQQGSTGPFEIVIGSPQSDARAVPLQQPIMVAFNQAMDHRSTEAAVQIMPTTTVTFSWNVNTLYIQPTSGTLAPNTQYNVTIGPGAKTASNQPIPSAHTITFVTQPTATPSPAPTPTPRPNSLLTAQAQLAPLPQGAQYPAQWSADSSTVYFVGAGGSLDAVPAGGGDVKVLVNDGVSLPAISPAGDRIAYVRSGRIEILTIAGGATAELAVTPAPITLRWAKQTLIWAGSDGVYARGINGTSKLASIPTDSTPPVVSIAPDGTHAAFQSSGGLFLLDLASGRTTQVSGATSAAFLGWSPNGARLLYSINRTVVADLDGNAVSTLPAGDPSWSTSNEVLLGSDTDLFEVRPDGSGLTKLAEGTYHSPVWAPNGNEFTFIRGGALWSASAPPPPAHPSAVDQASAVATAFMQARLDGNGSKAGSYLDDAGKAAYSGGGPVLFPSSDAGFRRFYTLVAEPGSPPDLNVRIVVRLVFGHAKRDESQIEETLVLSRRQNTDPFLIHGAAASTSRDLAKGPEVVAVQVAPTEIKVTFDSDLVPGTVASGVLLQSDQLGPVKYLVSYAERTVTITGIQLEPGVAYRLVVLPEVLDVGTPPHHVASEYDLVLIGPGASVGDSNGRPVPPVPTAVSPSPR
jgi:hypothetical protein